MSDSCSPAVAKLLSAADEVLKMALDLQTRGRPGDAVAFAMFANEYVRAARAMQDMENASATYKESTKFKTGEKPKRSQSLRRKRHYL